MNEQTKKKAAKWESPAQIVDRLLQRTAIGVSLMTVAYAMSATMYVIDDPGVVDLVDTLQLILGILVLLVLLPAFFKYARLHYRQQGECPEEDGYLVEIFKRASAKAFGLTFVFMVILEKVTEKYLTELPTPFFIDTILAFSLGVLSIAFFRVVRSDRDDEVDDDFDTGQGA
jgi:hypothetical protein